MSPQVIIVRKSRKKAYGLLDVESRQEKEARIAMYLEQRIERRTGPRPLVAQIVYAHDLKPAESAVWTRISFWKYYNLGDFAKFWAGYAPYPFTAANLLPPALLARFLRQMLASIQWLISVDVFHRDLAFRNIFVHWAEGDEAPNFFVGDFGCAVIASEPADPSFDEYENMSPAARA